MAVLLLLTALAPAQAQVVVYSEPLDSDPGWSLTGAWFFGPPQGLGGDPASAFTGNNIFGHTQSGTYANGIPAETLTSTAIDCSILSGVVLRYRRWLGVERSVFDRASVEVSNDGANWTVVYTNPDSSFQDTSWQLIEHDISAVADGQSTVFLRWVMGPTDSSVVFSGWNIDDIELLATPDCVQAPYPISDPVYLEVITNDSFCCNTDWDSVCQEQYNEIAGCVDSPYTPEDPVYQQVIVEIPACCADEWSQACEDRYNEIIGPTCQDPAAIAGVVFNLFTNDPVAGATVTITDPINISVLTDSDGAYAFDTLLCDETYTIEVSAPFFIDFCCEFVFIDENVVTRDFFIEPGGPTCMDPAALAGVVFVDGSSAVVPDATVSISDPITTSVNSDNDGAYAFDTLLCFEQYTVEVSAAGFEDFCCEFVFIDENVVARDLFLRRKGDFSGDGRVSLDDFLQLLEGWGTQYDLDDFLDLLNNWGAGTS